MNGTLVGNTPEEKARVIMLTMEQSYHRRLIEGTWGPKEVKTDKERIIALESTITEMKAAKPTERARSGPNNNANKNKKWAWKLDPPKAGAVHTIQKGETTYHWCPNHEKWCIHTPTECKLKAPKKAPVAQETVEDNKQAPTPPPAVKIDPVLESIAYSENARYFA
jgi:hypothetical protein